MADFSKYVRDLLSKNGCHYVRRGKGDHDIWYSPITKRNVVVDGKIKKKGSANGTLSKAGIVERL